MEATSTPVVFRCEICGKSFVQPKKGRKLFCSDVCTDRASNALAGLKKQYKSELKLLNAQIKRDGFGGLEVVVKNKAFVRLFDKEKEQCEIVFTAHMLYEPKAVFTDFRLQFIIDFASCVIQWQKLTGQSMVGTQARILFGQGLNHWAKTHGTTREELTAVNYQKCIPF